MTERESKIYEALKLNKGMKKSELAEKLGLSENALNMYIEVLLQKGYILENGDIVYDNCSVTIIGGSNIDMCGKCKCTPIMADSNIGEIKLSSGGVGRNIAENFARLGGDVSLVTAIARDVYGRKIFEQLQDLNIDIYDSVIIRDGATSTYMYILNDHGEMILSVNDMSIMKQLDRKYIESIKDKLNTSPYLFFDANLYVESIEAIFEFIDKPKIVVDPVSVNKVDRIVPYLDKIYCLKLNNYEAGKITGVNVEDQETAEKAGKILINKGLGRVYITLGDKGVIYVDKDYTLYKKAHRLDVPDVRNTTGAGDAFSAALLYSLVHKYSVEDTIELGMGASVLTIKSLDTCCPDLSIKNIKKELARIKSNE